MIRSKEESELGKEIKFGSGISRRSLLKAGAVVGSAAAFGTGYLGAMSRALAADNVAMWHGWTGADNTSTLNKVIALFKQEHPEVILEATAFDWDALFSKWVISYSSGGAPDLVLFHTSEVPEYAKKGLIIPAEEEIKKAGIDLDGVPDASIKASSYEGNLFAIPVDAHPLGMYFNIDLATAAGLDATKPPTTGDELIEWGKKLTAMGDNGAMRYGIDLPLTGATTRWLWFSLLHQFGGTFLGEDGKSGVDSEASHKALQFLVDLITVHKVADPNVEAKFSAGQVGIKFTGPWEVNQHLTEKMNFATAQLPVVGSKPAAWANSHCLSFSSNKPQEKIDAAATFAGWFFKNFAIPATTVGIIPLSPAARESAEFTGSEQYPYYKAFTDTLPNAVYEPALINYTQIFSFGKPTPLVINLQAALSGSKSVADALRDMKAGIDQDL
jgi:multiple sugar transport system substrate-binding protein